MRRIAIVVFALVLPLLIPGCMSRLEGWGGMSKALYVDRSTATDRTIGEEQVAPDGTITRTDIKEANTSKDIQSASEAKGPDVHANSGSVPGYNPNAPRTDAGPKGSGTRSAGDSFTEPDFGGGASWLLLAGGGLIVGAGLLYWWKRDWLLSAILAGSGVILIAFALYTWLALLGFIAILALLVYWSYRTGKLDYVIGLFVKKTEELKTENPVAADAITTKIGESAASDGTETLVRNVVDSRK